MVDDAVDHGGGVPNLPARLVADCVYGTKTTAAVKWYHGRVGVTADGLVGVNTWTYLRNA